MEIILSDTKSSYNLDATEKQEFNHWLDRVVLASDPEDLTGTIFIDNFVQPEKAHRLTASGLVTAIVQRHLYRNTQTDVSDFVIENDDVHETNAKAGIYFDVSSPEIDQGFPIFEIMFRDEVFEHPRYSGVTYATLIPPNDETPNYLIDIRRNLHRHITSRSGQDYFRYVMAGEEDVIQSQIAIDPDDIIRGIITMRPFNSEESKTNSLKHHVEFIARVTGIPAPDLLDNKQ